MFEAAPAFVAHPLDQLGVRSQFSSHGGGPGSCIRPWVGERHFDIQIANVASAVTFGDTQRFRVWMAVVIEPGAIIEPEALHDERLSLPVPD
jgi:hypothetical protein